MTDEQGYNGWKNYETWVVALWLDNEEGTYELAREQVVEGSRYETADALKMLVDELLPDLGGTLAADLMGSAVERVDWFEVADHYLSEQVEA